jgi:hypothetical protein
VGNSVAAAMIPVPSGVSGARTIEVRHVFAVLSLSRQGRPALRTAAAGRQRCGSGGGGGIKTASKPFSKLFQISGCFRQAFPKKALAVLWDSKGLQGSQAIKSAFQIFRPRRPPFAHIPDAPHRIPPPGAVTVSKPQIAISKFSSSELRHPTRILASLKCSKSTLARISLFRSKIAALALLASKIEHRVVVGPDPLIVGSSAAGHHHILDAAHLSRQAAQGLSRLEAEPERGTGVRAFCRPAVDSPRRSRLS